MNLSLSIPDEPNPRPRPFRAEGCRILDAAGNDVGSTSRPGTAAALVAAYNFVYGHDAPACDVCGSITVLSHDAFRCLNCGNAMGHDL